jgi:hypothetical protein
MSVNRVILKWDSAYAKAFKIQVSSDASTWTDVFSTTTCGMRSVTDETFPTNSARYVRMYGTLRGNTAKGYSLFDFMVLNDSVATATTFKTGTSSLPSGALLTRRNNTIQYTVPSSNSVKLDVVDIHGKLVAVLADGFKHAGDHKAFLPGAIGCGMYILRLTTGAERIATMHVRL